MITAYKNRLNHPFLSGKAPVLDVRTVSGHHSRRNGKQSIFEEVSLHVKKGEIVCLLGASGCGKSTLLRTVAGLQRASSGEVHLKGNPLSKPHPEVGFVFQKPTLLPWLNVRNNVALGLLLWRGPRPNRKDRHDQVATALESVGLQDYHKLRSHQLSGGMAQRASLARALARRPSLLILDEPLGALDAITRLEMQKLILEITQKHSIGVLWVTHDIEEALLVGDRVLLMDRQPGRIVKEWEIPLEKPRFDQIQALNPIRTDILLALSKVAGPLRTS